MGLKTFVVDGGGGGGDGASTTGYLYKSVSSDFNEWPQLKTAVFKVITLTSFFHLFHL